jgi:hypothetical protein
MFFKLNNKKIYIPTLELEKEIMPLVLIYRMKTKGDQHSNTKVKKLASVDVEKVSSIKEFVEYAVTENRMEQAVSEIFGKEEPTIQKMGDFLRWLIKDIVDEESDTLEENGLSVKDIGKYISNAARPWFQNLLNQNVGL